MIAFLAVGSYIGMQIVQERYDIAEVNEGRLRGVVVRDGVEENFILATHAEELEGWQFSEVIALQEATDADLIAAAQARTPGGVPADEAG